MKKNFVNRFVAMLLLACMVLSLPVFAVDRYYLEVTISEQNAPNYELTDTSGYLSLDESLTTEIAIVVGSNITEQDRLDRTGLYGFESKALNQIIKDGLQAKQDGDAAWSSWVDLYYASVTNVNAAASGLDMKAKLRDLDTKVNALTPGVTYSIDFTPAGTVAGADDTAYGNTYTVSIVLYNDAIYDDDDGGDAIGGGGAGTSALYNQFTDLAPGEWYTKAVDSILNSGIMAGYGDNKFGPDDSLNRAMMVQIIYNMESSHTGTAKTRFADVAADMWYDKAIHWAAGNKIAAGYGEDLFRPEQNVTREEVVQFLYNYYVKFGGNAAAKKSDLSAYTDGGQVASYHLEAMQWGVGSGVLVGKGNGILDPKGLATRAEAAQMIWNFRENVLP